MNLNSKHWRKAGTAYHMQSTTPKVKCAGSCLMLWGWFSATEGLVRVEEKLSAPKYRDSLDENPVQSIQNLRRAEGFAHDVMKVKPPRRHIGIPHYSHTFHWINRKWYAFNEKTSPNNAFLNLKYPCTFSFCFNYCLNSARHGGDQFVALLRWYGSPGFFDSGIQLICIVGSGAFGTFGSVGRCQVLLENEISISILLGSRRKHEVL